MVRFSSIKDKTLAVSTVHTHVSYDFYPYPWIAPYMRYKARPRPTAGQSGPEGTTN